MHRLFTIEHLIREICSYVPPSELPTLAVLSSTWFRCAISLLYYDEDLDINEALEPLGKIILDGNSWRFANPPSDDDFERFLKYSPHVRFVRTDSNSNSVTLEAVRRSVARGIYLFPNIHRLGIDCQNSSPEFMEILVGLISPKIEQLSLRISDIHTLHYFCSLVMTRLPVLHTITIQGHGFENPLESSLATKPVQDLLTFFAKTLTSVHIPRCLNTPSIAECLSKMPRLCNLTIGDYESLILETNKICGDEGGFPSLRTFSFDGSPQTFHDMFSSPYGLASLTILSLNGNYTPANVRTFVSSVVAACPHIKSLHLGESALINKPKYPWPVVPWSYIQPISCCKELTALSLNCMRVSVTLEELTEFLKSRITWTRLHILTAVPLRLQDMLLFAKYCPDLEHLGIYASNSGVRFGIRDLPSGDFPTFSVLTSIDFSGSTIKSTPNFLAQFLKRICKKPPYSLCGLSGAIASNTKRRLAVAYIDEHRRTKEPLSSEVAEFIQMLLD